jgi:hypothetical protein
MTDKISEGIGVFRDWNSYGRPTGFFLIRSFLFGVGPYNLRDHIPFSPSGCIGATVLAYAILSHGETIYLALLPIPSDEQVPAYAPVATRCRSAAPSPLRSLNWQSGRRPRAALPARQRPSLLTAHRSLTPNLTTVPADARHCA